MPKRIEKSEDITYFMSVQIKHIIHAILTQEIAVFFATWRFDFTPLLVFKSKDSTNNDS